MSNKGDITTAFNHAKGEVKLLAGALVLGTIFAAAHYIPKGVETVKDLAKQTAAAAEQKIRAATGAPAR